MGVGWGVCGGGNCRGGGVQIEMFIYISICICICICASSTSLHVALYATKEVCVCTRISLHLTLHATLRVVGCVTMHMARLKTTRHMAYGKDVAVEWPGAWKTECGPQTLDPKP